MTTAAVDTTANRPLTRDEVKVGDFLVLPYRFHEIWFRDYTRLRYGDFFIGQVAELRDDDFTVWPVGLGICTTPIDRGDRLKFWFERPTTQSSQEWENLGRSFAGHYIRPIDGRDRELLEKLRNSLNADVVELQCQLAKAQQIAAALKDIKL